jgi:hypothetical protein
MRIRWGRISMRRPGTARVFHRDLRPQGERTDSRSMRDRVDRSVWIHRGVGRHVGPPWSSEEGGPLVVDPGPVRLQPRTVRARAGLQLGRMGEAGRGWIGGSALVSRHHPCYSPPLPGDPARSSGRMPTRSTGDPRPTATPTAGREAASWTPASAGTPTGSVPYSK